MVLWASGHVAHYEIRRPLDWSFFRGGGRVGVHVERVSWRLCGRIHDEKYLPRPCHRPLARLSLEESLHVTSGWARQRRGGAARDAAAVCSA